MEINFWLLFKKLIKYQNVYMCRKSVEETFGVFEMGRKYTNSKRYVYKSFVYRLTKVLTVCQIWNVLESAVLSKPALLFKCSHCRIPECKRYINDILCDCSKTNWEIMISESSAKNPETAQEVQESQVMKQNTADSL